MSDYIIVSSYTVDSPYEEEVKNLIASCDRFKLPHKIEGYKTLGSWERNCQYKAMFLKEKLQELQSPIVWVDADGVFRKRPDLFETLDCDFAAHIHQWPKNRKPNIELISSCLYLNNTPVVMQMLDAWIAENDKNHSVWDQKTLQKMVEGPFKDRMKFVNLPEQYCKIFDSMRHIKDPVIEQFQASRRFKRKMGTFRDKFIRERNARRNRR
jgi:hypothetical protein